MSPTKKGAAGLITIALEILVGIFLLMNPERFMKTIIIVVGIGLLVIGVVLLIRFLMSQRNGSAGVGTIIGAIVSIIFGLVCIFAFRGVIELISVFIWVIGIFLLIAGILKVVQFFSIRKAGYSGGGSALMLISGIIMTVFGLILILHPFGSLELLLQVGGIVLIMEALLDLVSLIITLKDAPREVK